MEEFRLQFKSDALSCNMKQPLSLLTFANTQTQYNAKQYMLKDKLVSFSFRLHTFKSAFPLEMKIGSIYVSLLLLALDTLFDGSCNFALFFSPSFLLYKF